MIEPILGNRHAAWPHDHYVTAEVLLAWWAGGLDTTSIAHRVGLHESQVANRLAELRDRHWPLRRRLPYRDYRPKTAKQNQRLQSATEAPHG